MKAISTITFALFFTVMLSAQNPVLDKLSLAEKAQNQAQFKMAEKHLKEAYQLIEKSDVKDSLIFHTELRLGRLFLVTSDFEKTELWLDKALKSNELLHGPDHISAAIPLSLIAKMHNRLYNTDKSKAYVEQMLEIYLHHLAPDQLSEAKNEKEPTLIDTFIRQALETDLLDKIPEVAATVGGVTVNLLLQLSRLTDAEKLLLRLQPLYKTRNEPKLLAATYSNLGQISEMRYQYALAQEQQLKAIAVFKKGTGVQDKLWLANIWRKMARNQRGLGRSDSAIVYFNKALTIYEDLFTLPNQSIASTYSTMAYDHLVLGNYEKSFQFIDKAFSSGITDKLTLLHTKGLYHYYLGQVEEAAFTYKKALTYAPDKYHANKANVLTELANLLRFDLRMPDSAQTTINQAIAVNTGRDIMPDLRNYDDFESSPDPINLLNTLIMKANMLTNDAYETNDFSILEECMAILDLAETLIGYLRLQFILEEDNITFSDIIRGGLDAFLSAYTVAYDQTGDQQYLHKAFEYSDMNKSQALLEALKSSTLLAEHENSLLSQWATLKKDIKYQETSLQNLRIQEDVAAGQITDREKEIEASRDRLAGLLKKITKESGGLVNYISDNIRKSKAEELQKYLGRNNSVAIQYYISSLGVYQFLATEDSISYKAYAWGDTLEIAVNQVVEYIGTNETSDTLANQQFLSNAHMIYNKLFEVLPDNVYEDKDLIIIPAGYLSKLPFEVLLTDAVQTRDGEINFQALPYLIRERKISYAFSSSVLMESISREVAGAGSKPPTAWAPYSDASDLSDIQAETFRSRKLDKLKGAAREVRSLADKFKGEIYMNEAATESNFKSYAQESDILHIATHGITNRDQPEMSYLVFANEEDNSNDGYLHLFEVYDMQINNDLTILSACQSGDGSNLQSEGVISMARAFTYAGSKSVLMSLWLANDNSTSKVIQDFYTHLEDNKTKSEALRSSKLAYLESANNVSAHPFYWAHLVISGDQAPLSSSKFPSMLILAGLFFLILSYFAYTRIRTYQNSANNR